MIVPILQRKELQLRQGKRLTQGHTVRMQTCPAPACSQGSIFPKSCCAWRSLEGAGWGKGILRPPEEGITAERKLTVPEGPTVILTVQ